MAHYCLTSTIMLSLTTDDEPSGKFGLSGSIRRQVSFSFYITPSMPFADKDPSRHTQYFSKTITSLSLILVKSDENGARCSRGAFVQYGENDRRIGRQT